MRRTSFGKKPAPKRSGNGNGYNMLFIVLVLLVIALLIGGGCYYYKPELFGNMMGGPKIKDLDVLFFMSPTCPWCKKMVAVMEKENTLTDVMVVDVSKPEGQELAKKYGIVTIDANNRIIDFVEKPQEPKSTLSSTGIYFYPKHVVKLLMDYGKHGENTDKAGNFLEMLYKKEDVFCYVSNEKWFDIGSFQQLEEAKKSFKT